MNTKLPLITASALVAMAACASAATLASWTFETVPPTTAGPIAADTGLNAASSFASSNTGGTFSNPVGNGSVESYSSNGWTVGEYFQFSTSTAGYTGVTISFDQMGSNTGPRDFKLQYSTDGTTFTDVTGGAYTVINGNWSTVTPNPLTSYSFNLSAITVLNNDASVFFRLTDTSTTAITGGTVAAAGTGRVDNVTITAVPEPQAASLLGALGVLGLIRRRR